MRAARFREMPLHQRARISGRCRFCSVLLFQPLSQAATNLMRCFPHSRNGKYTIVSLTTAYMRFLSFSLCASHDYRDHAFVGATLRAICNDLYRRRPWSVVCSFVSRIERCAYRHAYATIKRPLVCSPGSRLTLEEPGAALRLAPRDREKKYRRRLPTRRQTSLIAINKADCSNELGPCMRSELMFGIKEAFSRRSLKLPAILHIAFAFAIGAHIWKESARCSYGCLAL